MDEAALDLLEAAYMNAETTETGGQSRLRFRGSDAANPLGLSTAERDSTEATAYHRALTALVDAGAVEIPDTREQEQAGETFYEITTYGETVLREAGRIV